ncbi:peroxisomal membrane anchor protein conserved region-domain-containing protein [Russula aff. rugulosa BPL654]|nr:peroxisomal membrane anchor protein conserved region-domain-containing protein [Russula aff. rugulosa BPL654]
MADRQEYIRNAVSFLADPKAQASSLAQRVQFLEAKGLTGPEIEEALRQANTSRPLPSHIQQPPYGPVYGPLPYVPQLNPPWDWRDYFITAVVSGSLAYGAFALARKYLFPHLQPPSSTAYQEDRDALTAQFDAAEALLKEIRSETSAVKVAVENQQEKVDKATADVDAAVQQMKEGELRARNEIREIREEVNNIREMIPKMIEKNKDAQTQSLGELQQDLKSLKTLLLNRTPSTSVSPPLPTFPPRPSIPSWQLSESPGSPAAPILDASTRLDLILSETVLRGANSVTYVIYDPLFAGQSRASRTEQPRCFRNSGMSSKASLNHFLVPSSPAKPATERMKSKLEDRLRASFTIGEVSNPSTPTASARASPAPQVVTSIHYPMITPCRQQQSPCQTPLPRTMTMVFFPQWPLSHYLVHYPPLPEQKPSVSEEGTGVNDATQSIVTSGISCDQPNIISNGSVAEIAQADRRQSDEVPIHTEKPQSEHSSSDDVEALQEQLKLMEQQFADVSASFAKLQAENLAADNVLQEMTSVQGCQDADGLRNYLQNAQLKVEELRETHRLESGSQIGLVDELRSQLQQNEALLKATRSSNSQLEADIAKQKPEMNQLRTEVERLTGLAKGEEEKCNKAINHLKTIRQRLVKAEKDRDDALKEVATLKEGHKAEHDKQQLEREKLQSELNKLKVEKEVSLADLRAQFEKELMASKQRSERKYPLCEASSSLKLLRSRSGLVSNCLNLDRNMPGSKRRSNRSLEKSVQSLSAERDSLFDQLQIRQAEGESAQSLLEVLQSQNTELQYQVRENDSRIAQLNEELSDFRKNSTLAHEAKLTALKQRLASMEAERVEVEAEWRRKVEAKQQEAQRSCKKVERLRLATHTHEYDVSQLRQQIERLSSEEETSRQQLSEQVKKISNLDHQLEEITTKELQVRTHNKTLREELRKVQSSAALLDRLRGPGVGYWSSATPDVNDSSSPASSLPSSSSRPDSPIIKSKDEELNHEYLRTSSFNS